MKYFLTFLIVLLINFSCKLNQPRVLKSEIKKEAGLYYYQGKPFTGISFTMWDEKNVKTEQTFKDGNLNGISQLFFEDGSIKEEINFKNGYMHGKHKKFFEKTGQLKQEMLYEEGKRIGIWKDYYSGGKVASEIEYKDELPSSTKTYYENGKIKLEEQRINGKVNGRRVIYFENGKIMEVGNYIDNIPTEPYLIYDENGNVLSNKSDLRHILISHGKYSVKKY
jgi:antitoxin component YwqK of YwqJK toxin-antitoxin module